jgi:hypothetical protein
MTLHKDLALDRLAELGNVAQFVAFRPSPAGELAQTTSRVAGTGVNEAFPDEIAAATALLERSGEGAVNVRSYLPDDPRSREFVYGIRSVPEAVGHLRRLAGDGLHLILNETVDVTDGGVSGVVQGGVVEFAPDDTPRAVEKPGVASLPREMGFEMLRTVYGFAPETPAGGDRVEFSIHPSPRGWRSTGTLLWEIEPDEGLGVVPVPRWPNRFSRHIGDKTFGLLVADQLGAPVPATTAIPRRIAPFSFGRPTGSLEVWTRTCPVEPRPGLYTTVKGWTDPFALLTAEDHGREIAAVLAQRAVPAAWSGATLVGAEGRVFIEGRRGEGDTLMLGEASPEPLPPGIEGDVAALHRRLTETLGPVRLEWVHDGRMAWVVQMHVGATATSETVLVDGEAEDWAEFDVARGLAELRTLLRDLPSAAGVTLRGRVGLTSHMADVARNSGRPTRISNA